MRTALVITNADAGGNDDAATRRAVTILRAGGVDVELAATEGVDDLDAALRGRAGRDVVVVGGDGSLHAAVSCLHRQRDLEGTAIGLIPLGTGNDLARGAGIPLDVEEAARAVLAGRPTAHDLLVDDDGGIVVNAVHVGVGAEAGRSADAWKPRLGRLGYVVGAIAAGLTADGLRLRVTADDVVLADGRHRLLQVAVGNGPFVGGGTELAPGADPRDGSATVMVSFAVGRLERLAYAARLRSGDHPQRDDVRVERARVVEVAGEEFWCNADGELAGPFTTRRWTVHDAAWTLLTPDTATRA